MPLVDRLYDWLLQGPTPGADRILAAALPHAEPEWAGRMTAVLLQRGGDASWRALIGQYDRLAPEICALLDQPNEHMQAGIAMALRARAPEQRINALRALERQSSARMAYLLPLAVRDSSRTVRELAAEVFRRMAERFLEQPAPPADADDDLGRAYTDQRHQLALALDEALQTFELHSRIEVLEAALWFSRDLRQPLWSKLTARRSRAGLVVRERLSDWDHPRLAHFLLFALQRSEWRPITARILQNWQTVPQISALLDQDDLLDDPLIRRHLGSIHSPQWFTRTDDGLSELEPHLRRLAPRWVCHAAYTDPERLELLARWLNAPDVGLHSAVVHTLARIDSPGAVQLLEQVADSDSRLAPFARWCVEALDTPAVSAASQEAARSPGHRGANSACRREIDTDCAMLWLACRRAAPSARGELIATLRENSWIWGAQLRSQLRSPDPRDRVLALHIIGVQPLAGQFRGDVEPLLEDPVEGICQLARRLMELVAQDPAADTYPGASVPELTRPDDRTFDLARRELRATLERLGSGEMDGADGDLMARVRGLLREVYSEQAELWLAASPGGECR